jgi:hypothetical protein
MIDKIRELTYDQTCKTCKHCKRIDVGEMRTRIFNFCQKQKSNRSKKGKKVLLKDSCYFWEG